MKMIRFIKWLRRNRAQQSAASRAEQAPVSVRVRSEEETEGAHRDDSAFSWSWADQADSSIFDTGSLITEKSEDKNDVSHQTPDLEGDSLPGTEEDVGVDPYNTGRFDTENK